MSYKEQDKKNFGQFYQGNPNNRGKKPEAKIGKKPQEARNLKPRLKPRLEDDAETSQKYANNSKIHGIQVSTEYFNSSTSQQKANIQQVGVPLLQTVGSYLSSTATGNQLGHSSQSANFTQVNVNVQSHSLVSGKCARNIATIPDANISQLRENARRGFSYKGPNVGMPPKFYNREKDNEAHIQVFNGSKEFSQCYDRPPSYCAPRNYFYSQRPRLSAQQISINPSTGINQPCHQSNAAPNLNQIHFHKLKKDNGPNFFNQNTPEHEIISDHHGNKNMITSNTSNTQYATVRAPVYKFEKNKVSNVTSQSNSSGAQYKIEKQQKSKHKRNQPRVQNWIGNKATKHEVEPLFSFHHISSNIKPEVKESVSSDDEEGTTLSRCSSKESIWTTNLSYDEDCESSGSELSLSSIQSSEIFDGITSKVPHFSKQGRYISVFWDIENCPVPHGKSAIDFVKLVRTTLYDGRTEKDFYAVCDIRSLSTTNSNLADELNLSDVTVIHINNNSKNAADSKIMSFLSDFPNNNTGLDSAIVLISGDCDFASILNKLSYKHIYIYLICKADARHSLIEAANKCIFYEKFVEDLPTTNSENIEYLIVISNFLQNCNQKKAKNFVSSKLKSVNCRVKTENMNSVTVILPDEYAREKASALLDDISLEGNKIEYSFKERGKTHQDIAHKESHSKIKRVESLKDKNSGRIKDCRKSFVNREIVPVKKGATLCVYVGTKLGDIDYWKNRLQVIFNFSAFSLQWVGSSVDGMFLVGFESLSKAQKVKKVLQKVQQTDPTCPKFLKLIKQDGVLDSLNMVATCQDINRKKIQDFLSIMDKKKEDCLIKHKSIVTDLKNQCISTVPGAAEAKAAKLNELNEQKLTFINFAEKSLNKVKLLGLNSETIEETLATTLRDFTRECNCLLAALPIYAKKNMILKKINDNQAVVIRAETGSGKSTQLTQYLWRESLFDKGLIVCTQPRKIAAITLAKHVSSQIGCSLGDIVGYQVGMTAKRSEKTAILYVTDFTMLRMIVDNDLKDIACIIIDEAHERTVYTDLLLGMIKKCLHLRPKLKLIITSATIDVSIFKIYLNLPDEAILEVSGRTFPVEDVWLDQDVDLGWDYFKKTTDTVCNILDQDPGDVLAFLTTPFETEKAMKSFSERIDKKISQAVKVFQLHGKLDVQEQQKIFEHTPDGVRKIVFATNCAETSVTIPGIKYVVDCGMVKESQYDAVRNMNVMSVNFVSKSSAEQRKGRAGRTGIGKCYRLYSKANYDKMTKCSQPEILRVNLGQAMLKLMKLGVKDPLQFEFVQSPPQESLNSVMKQLISLKAVNETDLSLSELGERMSYLPVEPRLSFMVLTGIDLNIGYEAIVLTSMITVSRNIFFRSAENKSEADSKKMKFCHESDFLTFFEVFKEWATVPKQLKSKWCILNCINARSLRTAHELVNELLHILDKEVKIKVAAKFIDGSVHNELLRLIFRSFYQNLCIFSGYHWFGYKSLNTSSDLLVHPSSSLYTYGKWRPDYLVYDTILQTNKTYLINVSPVTREMVLDCVSAYGLSTHFESLETLKLIFYKISPVGKSLILHDIIGKQGIVKRQLESQLKTAVGSDKVAVEINIQKGEITVYGPPSKYDTIESILSPMILKGKERLLNQERDVFIYPEVCAIISAGLKINDIVLPGEFRDVKVVLNTDIEISSVIENLKTCGPVCAVRKWKNYFKISFPSPLNAKLALKKFENEKSFTIQKIAKFNRLNAGINQYKVHVSFLRRPCTGLAFVTLDPPPNLLMIRNFLYESSLLKCSMSKKSTDIRILGLPPHADKKKLEKIVNEYITGENKLTKCLIVKKKNYESTPEEITGIKQTLIHMFAVFTQKDKFNIELKKPASHECRWHANVYFQNAIEGELAVSMLKNCTNFDLPDLQLKPELRTSLYCKLEVYWAVKKQIDEALKYFCDNALPDNTLEIKGFPREGGNIQIQMLSNNVRDMLDARKSLMCFILGDPIDCFGNKVLEKLFSNAGREFLKKIADQKSDCYIELSFHKKVINIFGDVSTCNFVKLEINKFLDHLEEDHYEEIHLLPDSGKPGVLRELLKNYGYDLRGLKDICELNEIILDLRKHILEVKGSSSSVSKCQDVVKELKVKLQDITVEENSEFCPVCFDQVSGNLHRLEYCGHAYCKDCILHWFQSITDFPLICMTCKSHIVLADIQWASKEVKSFESEMFKKSLSAFVNSRDDVSYCPSPDCSMVFRVTDDGNVFVCPTCNNSICTKCKELYHFGVSCSLYQFSKDSDDYTLKAWMAEKPDDRKCCPSCSSPIEKNGGCNHMTCYKCNCHMCWLCLQVFPPGNEVYDHQPFCPKKHVKQF